MVKLFDNNSGYQSTMMKLDKQGTESLNTNYVQNSQHGQVYLYKDTELSTLIHNSVLPTTP